MVFQCEGEVSTLLVVANLKFFHHMFGFQFNITAQLIGIHFAHLWAFEDEMQGILYAKNCEHLKSKSET